MPNITYEKIKAVEFDLAGATVWTHGHTGNLFIPIDRVPRGFVANWASYKIRMTWTPLGAGKSGMIEIVLRGSSRRLRILRSVVWFVSSAATGTAILVAVRFFFNVDLHFLLDVLFCTACAIGVGALLRKFWPVT